MDFPLSLLACPGCAATTLASGPSCVSCGLSFPTTEGLPWLYAAPEAAIGEWKGQFLAYLHSLEADVKRIQEALKTGARASTRTRLETLEKAKKAHGREILEFLKALPLAYREPAAAAADVLLEHKLPRGQSLVAYYHNAHRDWAWGEVENRATLAAFQRAFGGDKNLGNTAILGAGAGRLAYDIHEELAPQTTLLVDANPLLLLVASRIFRGERVTLHEFPLAPIELTATAVAAVLAAPRPARAGIHCVLGDALRPPLARAAFDTVVTPWFVDIIPEKPEAFACRINSLLRPGGRWINLGSLAFQFTDPKWNLSPEEFTETTSDCGFTVEFTETTRVPYMKSPHSAHGREEALFVSSVRKNAAVDPPAPHSEIPDWVRDPQLPVPKDLQKLRPLHAIPLEVLDAIDGKISLMGLADKVLVHKHKLAADEALATLRNFFLARL